MPNRRADLWQKWESAGEERIASDGDWVELTVNGKRTLLTRQATDPTTPPGGAGVPQWVYENEGFGKCENFGVQMEDDEPKRMVRYAEDPPGVWREYDDNPEQVNIRDTGFRQHPSGPVIPGVPAPMPHQSVRFAVWDGAMVHNLGFWVE